MECLQKRINQCREWEVLLVIKNSEDERFELKTRLPGNTVGATWKGLPYEPVGIKAVQGHNRWVTDKLGHANFIKRVYSLDPEYVPKMVDEGQASTDEHGAGPRVSVVIAEGPVPLV